MGLRRNKKLKRLAGSQPVRVADPGLRGLWARSPGGLGPGPPGLWARPTRGLGPFQPPGGSLAKAWVSAETAASEVGPGGKRSRDTPPTPPPHPPRVLGL